MRWEQVSDTCNNFRYYTIHLQETKNDNFQVVDTIESATENAYSYQPNSLDDVRKWAYFIKAHRGCPGDTVIFSDTTQVDKTRPEPIELDSISVRNGNIVLGWSPHQGADVEGYNIYYVDDGQTRQIDTVLGVSNTSYVDSMIGNPRRGVENYRLGAFDSCRNASPISLTTHKSMYLQSSVDSCGGIVTLEWSNYQGWDVDSFGIFVGKSANQRKKAKMVGGETFKTTLDTLQRASQFNGIVRAYQEGGSATSSSNEVTFRSFGVSNPKYTYIREATVIDSLIQVNWFIDQNLPLSGFIIYRGEEPDELSRYQTIPYKGGRQFTYVDSQAEVSSQHYYYRVRAKGICGNIVDESNRVKTMVLDLRDRNGYRQLMWEEYRGFDDDVKYYEVYRNIRNGDGSGWEKINRQQPAIDLAYDDRTTFETFPRDGVCYRIKAVEGDNNQYSFKGASYSNTECVFSSAIVHIPNAFAPKGENDIFRPVGRHIDYEESSMAIYNRWGEQVFQTSNIQKGWNGKINGKNQLAPNGIYIYTITIVGDNQQTETFKGDLTLIR